MNPKGISWTPGGVCRIPFNKPINQQSPLLFWNRGRGEIMGRIGLEPKTLSVKEMALAIDQRKIYRNKHRLLYQR
jgi:hypothetical protein